MTIWCKGWPVWRILGGWAVGLVLCSVMLGCGEDSAQLLETAQFEEQQHNLLLNDRFAPIGRVVALLDRGKKSIHIDMNDFSKRHNNFSVFHQMKKAAPKERAALIYLINNSIFLF